MNMNICCIHSFNRLPCVRLSGNLENSRKLSLWPQGACSFDLEAEKIFIITAEISVLPGKHRMLWGHAEMALALTLGLTSWGREAWTPWSLPRQLRSHLLFCSVFSGLCFLPSGLTAFVNSHKPFVITSYSDCGFKAVKINHVYAYPRP